MRPLLSYCDIERRARHLGWLPVTAYIALSRRPTEHRTAEHPAAKDRP